MGFFSDLAHGITHEAEKVGNGVVDIATGVAAKTVYDTIVSTGETVVEGTVTAAGTVAEVATSAETIAVLTEVGEVAAVAAL
jgi:hypothetical protein